MKEYDIHKAAGIIIQDGKELLVRSKGKEHFVEPGGKLIEGETAKQALIRELKEELDIDTTEDDFEEFGTFYAAAAGQEDKFLRLDVFWVHNWRGERKLCSEIEEERWIGAIIPPDIKVGSIFEHEIFPKLKDQGKLK
jgi:8-oxo-dGTP diphosphatase